MAAVTVSFKYLVLFALVAFTFATVTTGCSRDYECGNFPAEVEVCCNGECVEGSSCSTPSSGCTSDLDCADAAFCCDGKCKDDPCIQNTAFIVIGVVVGFMAIVIITSMCCCRRQRTITIERTVITTEEPLFHDPMPRSYQQSYSYPHPAPFGQPQMHVPPPYNPTIAAARAQPPPYTTATTGRSGGVYAPKTSYGAFQSAGQVSQKEGSMHCAHGRKLAAFFNFCFCMS